MKSLGKISTIVLLGQNVSGFLVAVSVIAALLGASRFLFSEAKDGKKTEQPIFFEPPSVDLGTVLQNETVRHDFRLVNGSTNELRIVGVHTSCSCTVFADELLGRTIRSHDAILVPVEYNSGTRDGPVSAEVTVYSEANDAKYQAAAALRAEVLSEFTVEPNFVDFGRLKPGEEETRTVVFRPKQNKGLRLTNAISTHKAFQALLRNGDQGSAGVIPEAAITFHAPRSDRRQTLSCTIYISTSSERVPKVKIAMRAVIVPEVEVTPNVLVLLPDDVSGEFKITVRTEHPSRITRVVGITSEGPKELQTVVHKSFASSEWLLTHDFRISNSALTGAHGINVELVVRNGTDRTEARSASVQVKSL